jgi:hypothetical protein
VAALLSLVVNAAVVIWLLGKGTGDVLIPLYRGNCSEVAKIDVVVHFIINILSTILLGGSNYCMQVLVAPTRFEVDKAHVRGKYLDIAVPSIRNLGLISRYKTCLWVTLAISSIPLHLLYNSAFFKSLSTNAYNVLLTTEGFINDQPTDNYYYLQANEIGLLPSDHLSGDSAGLVNASAIQNNLTSYDRLDVGDCIRTYENEFQSKRRNLVLVIDGDPIEIVTDPLQGIVANFSSRGTDPLLWQTRETYSSYVGNTAWICGQVPDKDTKLANPEACTVCVNDWQDCPNETIKWTPWGQKIGYCYSEVVEEQCEYTANLPIVVVVMVCNLLKAIAMLFVACWLGGRPLTTVGDAIASFLERSDPTTKGFCLLSRHRVQDQIWPSLPGEQVEPMPPIQSQRWFRASSTRRRYCLVFLLLVAIIAALVLLANALTAIKGSTSTVGSLGIGTLQATNIVSATFLGNGSATAQIMAAVFAANAPQAIMSFLYINLNAYLTVMWLASEFTDFATERKPLRVSRPKGKQRCRCSFQNYSFTTPVLMQANEERSNTLLAATIQNLAAADGLFSPTTLAALTVDLPGCRPRV